MLVTSVIGAAGSILNTIIGALPEIVSACRGCCDSSRYILCILVVGKAGGDQESPV